MPEKSKPAPRTRLDKNKDAANDLTGELVRLQRVAAANAAHDMSAFIQAEAEAALATLDEARRAATRR